MTERRHAPIDLSADDFRQLGHALIDTISDYLDKLPNKPVTPSDKPELLRSILRADQPLPENGGDPESLLRETARVLIEHSLFNGHPRFWGYITASPAPIGILGDLLASAVNPNVGSWILGPVATEIESQTIHWIAELIGYPSDCSGILVSGGNMANFIGFLSAKTAKADWNIREEGLNCNSAKILRVYASQQTHTWVEKAADLFGLGTKNICWIAADQSHKIDIRELRKNLDSDVKRGYRPFLIIGSAGTVSTGAVDPLFELASIAREYDVWFHVDGAYGGFAAQVPGVPHDLTGLKLADSVSIDPHKWLYAPLEAGCVLVRRSEHLTSTFAYHPPYYYFDESVTNYVDYGPQNSRGFRALKVWLALQQVGRSDYLKMIGDDISLARMLKEFAGNHDEIEVVTQELSIVTFRFVPSALRSKAKSPQLTEYLNKLNESIMLELIQSGQVFLSHARIDGQFLLRVCIVNFRTSASDIAMLLPLVIAIGQKLDAETRSTLQSAK